MSLPNVKPVNLSNDIRRKLLRLYKKQPGHILVKQYRYLMTAGVTEKNAADLFTAYRPEPESEFGDALVEFLAAVEDALEEAHESAGIETSTAESLLASTNGISASA
jgi:hypothetical protein